MSEGAGLFGIGQPPPPQASAVSTFLHNFALTVIWAGSTYVAVVANKLYDNYKTRRATTTNTIRAETSLKLEAQKVTAFSGNFADWARWKSRTQCAFDGSGYEKVLIDKDYATQNPRLNKVVYSQLSVATVDGNAFHLVKRHEESKNGHEAWSSLVQWFDGDTVKNETSEDIRVRMENLILHTGITATQYVNKFLTAQTELDAIPGEANSPSHSVYLFLRNIQDPNYANTVNYLRNICADLDQCVLSIRKTERDILPRSAVKRKLKSTLRRMESKRKRNDCSDSEESEEDEPAPATRTKKARRISVDIIPKESGYLRLDKKVWPKLEDDQRKFIQKYNSSIRHNEDVSSLVAPDGVTIKQKARRLSDDEDDEVKVKEEQDTAGDDKNDEGNEPDSKRQKVRRRRKKIRFPLIEEEEPVE